MSEALRAEACPGATLLEFPVLRSPDIVPEHWYTSNTNQNRGKSRLPVYSAIETAKNPPVPSPAIFDGLLRESDFMVVGAPRGAYKSWLMLDLGLLLASGEGSLFGVFDVAAPQRVLSIHGELDRWSVHQRRSLLLGPEPVPEGLFDVYDPTSVQVSRLRRTMQVDGVTVTKERFEGELDERLERLIAEYEPSVVSIDPWASFNGGEENSNDHAEAVYSVIRRLIDDYGVTVIAIHHFSQASAGGRDPEDAWRGASRLPDAASVRMTLEPYYVKKGSAERMGLSRAQARQYARLKFLVRRDETPDDFAIRWDPTTYRFHKWESDPDLAAANRRKPFTIDEILRKMNASGGSFESTKKAAEALRCSQAFAKEQLQRHVDKGELARVDGPRRAHIWLPATGWDTASPLNSPPMSTSQETP